MMTGHPWGFLEYERLFMQGVVLGLFVYVIRKLKRLIQQGIDDRQARMLAIQELQKTAETLADKTAFIAASLQERDMAAEAKLGGRLDNIDEQLRMNSALTKDAAASSKQAEHAANSSNEKIAETNQRLLEHVQGAEKSGTP